MEVDKDFKHMIDIDNKTHWNNKHIEDMTKKLNSYCFDDKQMERSLQQLCKYCFYVNTGRIAGQAFTKSNCSYCEKEMMFPTTDRDKYCPECAKKIMACKHCGARMD
jgi:hypothetical protein